MGYIDGMNAYQVEEDNPINREDPSGCVSFKLVHEPEFYQGVPGFRFATIIGDLDPDAIYAQIITKHAVADFPTGRLHLKDTRIIDIIRAPAADDKDVFGEKVHVEKGELTDQQSWGPMNDFNATCKSVKIVYTLALYKLHQDSPLPNIKDGYKTLLLNRGVTEAEYFQANLTPDGRELKGGALGFADTYVGGYAYIYDFEKKGNETGSALTFFNASFNGSSAFASGMAVAPSELPDSFKKGKQSLDEYIQFDVRTASNQEFQEKF